jgi:hypothetical protein
MFVIAEEDKLFLLEKNKDKIVVYSNTSKTHNINNLIDDLYELKVRVPYPEEILKNLNNKEINEYFTKNIATIQEKLKQIKSNISRLDYKIPLFDMLSQNMYIINKINVYIRVTNFNYRLPDVYLIEYAKDKIKDLQENIKENKYDKLTLPIINRTIKKLTMMLEFLENYDLDQLNKTYIYVFYENNAKKIYTTCAKPSYISGYEHIHPYYTRNEIVGLALNSGMKIKQEKLTDKDYENLCKNIRDNDIDADTILEHQKYIVKEKKVGLIHYYSLFGSSIINRYLRNMFFHDYKDDYLLSLISDMYDLVSNSPNFDKNYILYRFITNDYFLQKYNIGDIYIENGFMSTTRDPFYNTKKYNFGDILMKIRIPKNKKGCGICIETLSMFPNEEEILMTPGSKFKLLDKKEEKYFYQFDDKFEAKTRTTYEFEYIGHLEKEFIYKIDKNIYTGEYKTINFLELENKKTYTLLEKISYFLEYEKGIFEHFRVKIGDKYFNIMVDRFDSTGTYASFFSLFTNDGYMMYCFYEGHILFFIEFAEFKNVRQMRVNYFNKYIPIRKLEIMSDNDFILFLSSVAHYFEISEITLYGDHITCDIQKDKQENDDKIQIYGGTYPLDIYEYLKYGKVRFNDDKILQTEIIPLFEYNDIDRMKKIKPIDFLTKEDGMIYQIYEKVYLELKQKDNASNYFIWLAENRCEQDLINLYINKLDKIYGSSNKNPFKNMQYKIDAQAYLYNRNIIATYPEYITTNDDYARRIHYKTYSKDIDIYVR